MLSIFPALLSYSMLAVFVLRVVTGLFFMSLGVGFARALTRSTQVRGAARVVGYVFAACEVVVGGMFFVGYATQAAAIVGMILSFLSLELGLGRGKGMAAKQVHLLLFVLSLSLLFLGAGAFAFDLPI